MKKQRNKVSKGSQMLQCKNIATQKSSQQIETPISFRIFIKQWHLKYMRFTGEISEFFQDQKSTAILIWKQILKKFKNFNLPSKAFS